MASLEQKTDEELMLLYQHGNSKAFEILYARHAGKIFGFLKTKTQKVELARDFFQEVFIKIHRSKHLYNKSFPVLPWIFTITKNMLIDGLRKESLSLKIGEKDLNQIVSPEPSKAKGIDSLLPQVEKLPHDQVMALKMRYMEEKTFDEIAEKLKTSSSNARQLISRGIKRVKEMIGDSHEDS